MKKSENFLRAASALHYLLLVALLLVLVLFCGRAYEQIGESRESNYSARAQLSYIAGRASAGDAAGGAQVRDGVLVLTDIGASGNYETRFYLDSGRLLEEYSREGAPLSPEKAQMIGETSQFSAQITNGILTVKTDKGAIAVAVKG